MNTGTEMLKKRKNVGRKFAIASLVLGLLPVLMYLLLIWQNRIGAAIGVQIFKGWSYIIINLFITPLLGLSSLIIGIVALSKKEEEAAGKGVVVMAIAGIIFGILGLLFSIYMWFVAASGL